VFSLFRKKVGAVLKGMNVLFRPVENVIVRVFRDHAGEAYLPMITSANDGKHSSGSVHKEGKAIDIRIRDLFPDEEIYGDVFWQKVEYLCYDLANCLGPQFVVVLEKHHIHLQIGSKNIRNFKLGKNLYIQKRT
jgi:hypothetical protein